jgi:hypothetical protein
MTSDLRCGRSLERAVEVSSSVATFDVLPNRKLLEHDPIGSADEVRAPFVCPKQPFLDPFRSAYTLLCVTRR